MTFLEEENEHYILMKILKTCKSFMYTFKCCVSCVDRKHYRDYMSAGVNTVFYYFLLSRNIFVTIV